MQLFTKVTLPSNLRPDTKYPVIYALHGMGSDEEDIYSLVEDLKEEFILIAVRGPLKMGPGYGYFNIQRIGVPQTDSLDDILVQLKDLTMQSQERYPIDPTKQFFVGFSQGAILSMSLALVLGSQIKGIAAMHGYIPQHIKEITVNAKIDQLNVMITHGESDEMFPIDIGRSNESYFKERTHNVRFNTYLHGHSVSYLEKTDVIKWLQSSVNEKNNQEVI